MKYWGSAKRALIASLGSMACSLLFACASHAAWSAPQKIASSGVSQYGRPQLARDVAGDAVAVWERDPSGKGEPSAVEAATRTAGGSWSAPVRLASGRPGAGGPEVVMSSRGEATVVWEQATFDGKKSKPRGRVLVAVDVRSERAGGGWGHTVTLASRQERELGEGVPTPQAAVDPRGDVSVAFQIRERNAPRIDGKEDVLLFTRRDRRWRGPVIVARTVNRVEETNGETRLAFDRRGETILAWSHSGPQGTLREWVEALVLARNGKPDGRPQVLSSKFGKAYELDLAANSRGAAVLAWSEGLGEGQGAGPAEAVTRAPGGRFTNEAVILRHKSSPAVVAIDEQGTASALFQHAIPRGLDEEDEGGPLETAIHPVDGSWSTPQTVFQKGRPVALACGPHGELVALWEADALGGKLPERPQVIDASIQAAGGAWQPPATISPEGVSEDSTDLAPATDGQATAIWVREPTYATYLIETADYEPS
jgi:hypothetical protein